MVKIFLMLKLMSWPTSYLIYSNWSIQTYLSIKMSLQRRLNNTYQQLYRNRHVIAQKLKLSDQEYRLWDFYLATYDWDKNHSQTYECVEASDRDVASFLRWSPSKVCRARKKLTNKGVIAFKSRSLYKVLLIPNKKTDISLLQLQNASVKQKNAEMKQRTGETSQSSIVSYKDKYISKGKREDNKQEIRSNEEYQRIYEESDCLGLTPDDMKWIDENIK